LKLIFKGKKLLPIQKNNIQNLFFHVEGIKAFCDNLKETKDEVAQFLFNNLLGQVKILLN